MIYQTDDTRNKILDNAERCFSEHGFFETQMKDIAIAIGMSRNTLYRYYRDKFELGFAILEKTLRQRFEQMDAQINALLTAPHINVRQELGALFKRSYEASETDIDHRFVAEFDAFYSGERIPEDFRTRLSAAADIDIVAQLERLIKRGQHEGNIRADLDARVIGTTLTNAIQAFHQRLILRQGALIEFEHGQPGELTPVLISLLMDGLKPSATE